MRDALWTVAFVLLLSGAGIYAGVSCWWRRRQRRRGVVPRDVHPFFLRRSREWVERELETTAARMDAIREAETVVREADARLGPLYEAPVPSSDSSVVRLAEVIVEAEHARTVTEER
jgi:hypothetical protein